MNIPNKLRFSVGNLPYWKTESERLRQLLRLEVLSRWEFIRAVLNMMERNRPMKLSEFKPD